MKLGHKVSYLKDKVIAIFLIFITITAPLIISPIIMFWVPPITDFSVNDDLTRFRVGYPIPFQWELVGSPKKAILLWGDGSSEDITENRTGSITHSYTLQGRYSPTLLVWNSFGTLASRSVDIIIKNRELQFDLKLTPDVGIVCEGREVSISVDNIYMANEELRITDEELNFVFDVSESQIITNKSTISYSWSNTGTFPISVTIMDSQGVLSRVTRSIKIQNEPPNAEFSIISDSPYQAHTPIEVSAEKSSDTSNDEDLLQYVWNWGDNTVSWGKYVSHSYYNPGMYNISLCVIDDDAVGDTYSQLITVEEPLSSDLPVYNSTCSNPYIAIGTFVEEAFEDDEVQFTAEVNRNLTDFSVVWSFGDGTFSSECAPKHAWSKAGTYNIVLEVINSEGESYTRSKQIIIQEKAPEIVGPFIFQGIEGQVVTLDVEVYDSIRDIPSLKYMWYNEKNLLISTEKKPTLLLSEGLYSYRLNVSDAAGMSSSQEITIEFHPISHEVYVPSYMYHGVPGEPLQLRAYIYDTDLTNSEYEFYWTIRYGLPVEEVYQKISMNHHQISFECMETAIYQGEVKVVDSNGNTKVSTFEIFSFIDSSHNGINDEYEDMLHTAGPSTADATDDSDGDNLPDSYEDTVSHTDKNNPDTDDDGLYDGYDNSGVGEMTLGTNPLNEDSDGDGLTDFREYFGWDISIHYFENRSSFHTNSAPLTNDTDNDGLSDYEEFLMRTNPYSPDSDNDRLGDDADPFPTTWDKDEDFLSDYMELQLGTDINVSDTDLDGITDGEELRGWGMLNFKSNPVYIDSDNDFLNDFAEILNYKYGLENEYGKDIRVDLIEPVSVHFPEFFRTATIAQISFAITFGEYGENGSLEYGVEDQHIQNLNVIITKPEDNIVLYNSTTNSTRYFSQVVEITDLMNIKSLNYYGDYVIEVIDLDNELEPPKCILEQFEIQMSRFLDPLDEDFDDDGILDGIEMELLVEGIDIIDIHEFYNTTLENVDPVDRLNEFCLEIPQTGRVYNGNLIVEIESDNILLGSGNVSIQLIKQNVNHSIDNVVLVDEFEKFSENEQFRYYKSLNLSQLVENGLLSEYCGDYVLKINVQDTDSNDTFIISDFYIETETYVKAGVNDTNAWITDPALEDTDQDGWSDYYEIFTSETNPLTRDMDGDSAWDPYDRDPSRNIMIEIRPISASWEYQYWPVPSAEFEMAIQFNVNDRIDPDFSDETSTIGFFTPSQITTVSDGYHIAWWEEDEGHHYYIDISDDRSIQSGTIPFQFQLWLMNSDGDYNIFESWLIDTYTIRQVGNTEILVVEKRMADGTLIANIRCAIKTIAIERANTLAIYNPNITDFTGHYNEPERMNIIQLHIAPNGHYEATYSFLHENEGSTPDEWKENEGWIDSSDSGQNPTIIDEVDGHHKVVQFHDTANTKAGRLVHNWDNYNTGTMEFWLRMGPTTEIAEIIIRDLTDTNSIYFRFDADGYMKYRIGATYYPIKPYQVDRWYHLKFSWDCRDVPWDPGHVKLWHLWVDGVKQGNGYEYRGDPFTMNSVVLQTDLSSTGYYFFIDAIGYSFDSNYEIGDNFVGSNCVGTPFNPGPNIIVIPTSLFTKTVLNSYFQKEQLDMTPLYSDQEKLFELYSIDRDGNVVEKQTGETDFVFVRYDITAHDAMEVLDSLLICATNQTTNENGETLTILEKTFDFVSTKLNGTDAVTMNLPHGIMEFIPWRANFESSSFGDAPQSAQFDFLALLLLVLFFILVVFFPFTALIFAVIVSIAFFAVLFTNIAANLGLSPLSFLGFLMWIIIRTALLIMFYVLLAIELLTNSLMFIGIGLVFGIMSGFTCNWSINWWVPYSINTQVGYMKLVLSESSFVVSANVTWTYWDYFNLYIPLLTMDSDIDSLLNQTLSIEPEEPLPPELACGWEHVKDLKYDFHVEYRQRPEGYPPEYVKLVLLGPHSNEEFEFLMEPTPGQQFDNYYNYVRFNYTVDFEQEFDLDYRQGQWHYYFISEASEIHTIRRWPYDGFAIGPLIDEVRSYLISSYQYPYSGNIRKEFSFEVMGADMLENQKPIEVLLHILWPNETIQSFSIPEVLTYYYNGTDFTTYERIFNFSHYISIHDRITLKYYFEATFSDGKISQLWDYEELDEDDYVDDDLANYSYIKCWFEGPTIYPVCSGTNMPPVIREWYIQDFTWNRLVQNTSSERVLYPVTDEFVLRFYVYIEDPDGTHDQHYRNGFEFTPKLILTNLDNPKTPLEPIDMKWTGGHYGPGPEGYEEYFVDILGRGAYAYKYDNVSDIIECDFGPGAWKYAFQVSDNQSHITIESPDRKIWHMGSMENMKNTLFYGAPVGYGIGGLVGSTVISIAYAAMALLASCQNHILQIVAQIISVGLLIADFAINIYSFIKFVFETGDTGAVLGLAFNFLLKSCGFLISLALSKDSTGRFNFNFLSKISGVLMALTIFNLFDEFWPEFETDENGALIATPNDDPTLNQRLWGWPMTIVSFFTSIVGLTSSLFVASGFAKFGGGSDGVSKIIIFHTILSFAMSAMCFVVFLQKSGFFHVAGEILYMNAYSGWM